MTTTLDTCSPSNSILPRIDLSERRTDDENGIIFIAFLGAVLFYAICRMTRGHFGISFPWGLTCSW